MHAINSKTPTIQGQRMLPLRAATTNRKWVKKWRWGRRGREKAIKEGVQSIFVPPSRQD
jgi:hypothetical protein